MATPPVIVDKKRSWGCCGCGCFTLLILALIGAAIIGVLAYATNSEFNKVVSSSGTTFATFDGGDQMAQATQKKCDDFLTAVHQHQTTTLELTADEINTMIAHNPDYIKSGSHIFISLPDNQAHVQFSAPLGAFIKANVEGRFVNGTMAFTPSFDLVAKKINLTFHDVQLGEEKVPANYFPMLQSFLSALLNEKMNEAEQGPGFLQVVQTIEIKDGELIIATE